MNTQSQFLTSGEVMARYGISDTTLHRWINDKTVAFPEPMKINRRRFFRADLLEAWERNRMGSAA